MHEIEILEWMIEEYNKRDGGYSQIAALEYAILCIREKENKD